MAINGAICHFIFIIGDEETLILITNDLDNGTR
jgi:hypothetical protein